MVNTLKAPRSGQSDEKDCRRLFTIKRPALADEKAAQVSTKPQQAGFWLWRLGMLPAPTTARLRAGNGFMCITFLC
jgi:hypothetical protein